jgi:hypothetical protein
VDVVRRPDRLATQIDSGEDLAYDAAVNVGQSKIAARVAVGQFGMVDPKKP